MLESFPKPKSIIEKSKKSLEKFGRFALLTTMLMGAGESIAQEKIESPEQSKAKIVELQKEAAAKEKNIVDNFKRIVTEGKLPGAKVMKGEFGKTPARQFIMPSGEQITVGYEDFQMTKPLWIMHQEKGGKWLMVDIGIDGSINKMVNYNPDEIGAENFAELYAFTPNKDMVESAKTTADLNPEDVKVFELNQDQNQDYTINVIDFNDGSSENLSGDQALRLAEKAQGTLTQKITDFEEQMNQGQVEK